jgi:hypothetical protein
MVEIPARMESSPEQDQFVTVAGPVGSVQALSQVTIERLKRRRYMFCVNCGTAMDGSVAACATCGGANSQLKSASREVGKKVKAASSDAFGAFKAMAVNPVGGLQTAFDSLGKERAMAAGIVFGAAFAGILVLSFTIALGKADLRPSLRGLFGMLILGIVPFLAIAGSSTIARKVFRGGGSLHSDVFISGSSLLPIGLLILSVGFLGAVNFEVIAILSVFALCYAINMLFVGSTRLSGVPEAFVTPAVAVMLLLALWLSKIIVASLIGSTAGELFRILF